MKGLAKAVLGGLVGYGIAKGENKKKIKNSSLEDYIKKYVEIHAIEDMKEFANDLRSIADIYEENNLI